VGQHLAEFMAEFWGRLLTRTTDLQDGPWVLLRSVDGARECHLQHQKSAIWSIFGYGVLQIKSIHEEYLTNEDGLMVSSSTWKYKIPTIDTIPQNFNVHVLNSGHHEKRVLSSKGINLSNKLFAYNCEHHENRTKKYVIECKSISYSNIR